MKTNLPKWKKKLTAKDRKHLDVMGMDTLRKFRATAEVQRKLRNDPTYSSEPCYDCKAIAVKLGVPV